MEQSHLLHKSLRRRTIYPALFWQKNQGGLYHDTGQCYGDACPIPVVKTLRALKELNGAGAVQTLVDNRVAVENLTRLAESKGCAIETEQLGEKQYRVTITAGEDAELRKVPMASVLFPPRQTTPW